jgi:hypothetical protein
MASPKISTLSESFDGLAINAGIWDTNTPVGTSVGLSNGTLQIQVTAGTNTAAGYPSVTTTSTYDLTNGSVAVQLPQQGTPTTGYENWPLLVQTDNNNATYAVLSGGFIGVYQKVAGVQTSVWFGAYDPIAIQWVRVRESGGILYWEFSFDGHTWSTWTNLSNPWAVTDLQVRIQAGTWAVLGVTETANFDNLNYNPNYIPRDWRVATVNAGQTARPAPVWDFILYGPGPSGNPTDPSTWSQLSDLPAARSRHVEVSLFDPGSASFSINGYHPDAALIQELGTDVRVERNGTAVLRGRIGAPSDDIDENGHTVSVGVVDYREMLKSKILYANLDLGSPTDVEFAVWHQIDIAQTRTNGTLGITRLGTNSGVTLPTQTGVVLAGASLFDVAEQFRVANGVEWDVDPTLVYQVFPAGRGSAKNWLLDLGGSVKKASRTVDVGNFANAIRVTGSTSGFTGTAQTADVNAGLATIGRWEKQEGNLDYTSTAQAQAAANSWVSTDAQVIPGYDLTLFQGVWGGPTDLWVGDRVPVEIISGRLNVSTTLRVLKMSIDIDEQGGETVVATLGNLSTRDAFYKANAKLYRQITQLSRR